MRVQSIALLAVIVLVSPGVATAGEIIVGRVSTPADVTFTFRAPGEPDRDDRNVKPPDGTRWVVVSARLKDTRGFCEVGAVVLKTASGESIPATGVSTDPTSGFIKFADIPSGVGRGPSSWAVIHRGDSTTMSVLEQDAQMELLFAVPTSAAPASVEVCTLGVAKAALAK